MALIIFINKYSSLVVSIYIYSLLKISDMKNSIHETNCIELFRVELRIFLKNTLLSFCKLIQEHSMSRNFQGKSFVFSLDFLYILLSPQISHKLHTGNVQFLKIFVL